MLDEAMVMQALRNVIDPELGIDVVELGMVGEIAVEGDRVRVDMALTSMSCPFWELFVDQVRGAVGDLEDVGDVAVRFDRRHPWSPERMTPAARAQLESVGLMPPRFRQPAADEPAGAQLIQLMAGVLEAAPQGGDRR